MALDTLTAVRRIGRMKRDECRSGYSYEGNMLAQPERHLRLLTLNEMQGRQWPEIHRTIVVSNTRGLMSRRLVEECLKWRSATMTRQLGRAALLEAYHRSQPITLPGLGVPILLTADTVYLPWKGSVYEPRAYTERLGFECPGCRGRALVLYGITTELWLQALGCQRCLAIIYYSENCHGNLWYEYVVKPRRRLRRIEARLAGRLHGDARERLEQEQASLLDSLALWEMRLQPQCPQGRRRRSRREVVQRFGPTLLPLKRPYRGARF